MHLRVFLTTAVALLPAVLFQTTPAEAQVAARTYKFTCVVERTLTDNTFGSLQRPVVCSVVGTFSSMRLVAGMRERQVRYRSAACLIATGATRCEGVISHPAEGDFRITAVTPARSLLTEAEVQTGALPVPNSPEVRSFSLGYEVRHLFAFPQVANGFYNASSPCDVNGDGNVSPLDVLALANLLNANGNSRINLSSYQPQPGSPKYPDTNNDWFVDDFDHRTVVGCLNSR